MDIVGSLTVTVNGLLPGGEIGLVNGGSVQDLVTGVLKTVGQDFVAPGKQRIFQIGTSIFQIGKVSFNSSLIRNI